MVTIGFENEGGDRWRFTCDTGSGALLSWQTGSVTAALILELYVSGEPRSGDGTQTLRWLAERFEVLFVWEPGEPGEASYLFWSRMRREGLIRNAYDSNGMVVDLEESPGPRP